MTDLTPEQKLQLFDEVTKDRGLYRQIVKKLATDHPETYIPEVELGNEIEQLRATHAEELGKLKAEMQAERDARAASEQTIKAKQELGLDDKGLEDVSKFMQDNGITDMDAGLKFKRLSDSESARMQARVEDRSTMQLPENFKEALKNRRGTRRRKLYEGIDALRKQQARAELFATH